MTTLKNSQEIAHVIKLTFVTLTLTALLTVKVLR
jgi:hypothetical protein